MAPKGKSAGSKKKKREVKSKGSKKKEVKDTFSLLQAIYNIKDDDQRNAMVTHLNKDGREMIYRCMYNCIYNKSISKLKRQQLREHLLPRRRLISYLANSKHDPVVKKKRLIRQTGNGILSLIPLILSAVLPLFASSKIAL